ncbi:MAG: helix-turn-helix domain-containing protein [Thermoanaerobaculia bacterium]
MIEPRRPTPQGRVILDRLEELSLSIAEIERRTHLTKNTIANAIYGPRRPQAKTIELLAGALELPIAELTRPARSFRRPGRVGSFGGWLWRRDNVGLWIGLAGAALTAVFLFQSLGTGEISAAVQVTHFGVAPMLAEDHDPELRLAWQATIDLRRYWGGAWMFWLFLYLVLVVTTSAGLMPVPGALPGEGTRWALVVLNLLQNGTTVLLLLCYEVVARPTLADDLSRRQLLPTEAWLAFVLLLSLVEGATVALALPWAAQQWFGWLSGFGQGTALALLVGRLDSKYIEAPTPVIASLYLYAAIQGAWPVFRWHYELMLILTFAALVLKCLLFLLLAWLFESRIVTYYLARLRQLGAGVDEDRREFMRRLPTGGR